MAKFARALGLGAAFGLVCLGSLAHADKIKDVT
jgi:hypothetical protein